MGINVNGLGTNPYAYLASAINKSSSQTNKTEAYSAIFEGKIAQTEKVELTEEEKQKIFDIDADMLSLEFHQLMPENLGDRRKNIISDVVIKDMGHLGLF